MCTSYVLASSGLSKNRVLARYILLLGNPIWLQAPQQARLFLKSPVTRHVRFPFCKSIARMALGTSQKPKKHCWVSGPFGYDVSRFLCADPRNRAMQDALRGALGVSAVARQAGTVCIPRYRELWRTKRNMKLGPCATSNQNPSKVYGL